MNTSAVPCRTHQRLADRYHAEGFTPGVPVGIDSTSVLIDLQACQESDCPRCWSHGLQYHPYHNGTRYRALAVCACGHAEEV